MTPAALRSLGTKLFGRTWQTDLARFLERPEGTHMSPRTIRRWAAGDSPAPFWVEPLLKAERERRKASPASD